MFQKKGIKKTATTVVYQLTKKKGTHCFYTSILFFPLFLKKKKIKRNIYNNKIELDTTHFYQNNNNYYYILIYIEKHFKFYLESVHCNIRFFAIVLLCFSLSIKQIKRKQNNNKKDEEKSYVKFSDL